MDHSFGRAKQKFFEALYALDGAPTIDIGLTYAASYLVQLQQEDLPAEMRCEYEKLRKALTAIPLSSPTSYVIRPVSEEKARELKQTIVEKSRALAAQATFAPLMGICNGSPAMASRFTVTPRRTLPPTTKWFATYCSR